MKNCVILEIRDSPEQVVFAIESEIDLRYGDEGVAKLFTEFEAAQEIDRLNRQNPYPDFRFQIVTLNPL